jgi:Helix-turn-helix domain
MASVRALPPPVKSDAAPFTFLMLPDAIAADPDLYPGAKILFAAILSLSRSRLGRCVASNEYLAKMTGLSVKQTKRLLVALEGRGLIARVMENHERLEIRITSLGGGSPKMSLGTVEGEPQDVPGDSPKMAPGAGTSWGPEITSEKSEREESGVASPQEGNQDPEPQGRILKFPVSSSPPAAISQPTPQSKARDQLVPAPSRMPVAVGTARRLDNLFASTSLSLGGLGWLLKPDWTIVSHPGSSERREIPDRLKRDIDEGRRLHRRVTPGAGATSCP